MAAKKLNLKIEQGATFKWTLTFQTKLTAVPINLTGQTFRGQLRRTPSQTPAVAEFTFTILDQTTDTGKVEMTMSDEVTSGIPVPEQTSAERVLATYCYDVEQEFPDGSVNRILEGIVTVSPEVTR